MLRDYLRLFKIIHIFLKARVDVDIEAFNTPKLLKVFFLVSPWRLYSSKIERGERLKKALEESGPIFIKFGQLLSTRPDAIPSDIAEILKSYKTTFLPFQQFKLLHLLKKKWGL